MTTVQRRPKKSTATAPSVVAGVSILDSGLWQARKECVLGIDQSLTGFAVVALCPADLTWRSWLYKPEKAGKLRGVQRLVWLQRQLDTTLHDIKLRGSGVNHVCMEAYAFSRQMGHSLGECGGMTKLSLIKAFGYTNQVAYPTIIAPNTLKKFVTNDGSVEKNQMLKRIFQKWGADFTDDNTADAFGLAKMAAAIVTGQTDHSYEHDIIVKTERHTEWPTEQVPTRNL